MDDLNLLECSCQGNNPDCYNCGGKGFRTEDDLIPDYSKFKYPSVTMQSSQLPHNPKDYEKPEVPNVLKRLEMKILKDSNRKALATKDIRHPKIVSTSRSKTGPGKPFKKQMSKGMNESNKNISKFSSSGKKGNSETPTWTLDQLLFMERIKENMKFMEPHYKKALKVGNKKMTHKGNSSSTS